MLHILSIAASDSCAGAGIQADIKTISALGAYALTAVTAVTAQNTTGIKVIQYVHPQTLRLQLEALFDDVRIDAIKIGMLGSSGIIGVLSDFIKTRVPKNCPIVLDPVLSSSTGHMLGEGDLRNVLKTQLLPLINVLTPNLPEAEAFVYYPINDMTHMQQACHDLLTWGPEWVLLKGGHWEGDPSDALAGKNQFLIMPGRRVFTGNDHGTGCTLSSALAVFLAEGFSVVQAVEKAKAYIETALEKGFKIGKGAGVLDHFHASRIYKED